MPALHGEQIISTVTQKQTKNTRHTNQSDKTHQSKENITVIDIMPEIFEEESTKIPTAKKLTNEDKPSMNDNIKLTDDKIEAVIERRKKKVTKKETIKSMKDGVESVEVIDSIPEILEIVEEDSMSSPKLLYSNPQSALIPNLPLATQPITHFHDDTSETNNSILHDDTLSTSPINISDSHMSGIVYLFENNVSDVTYVEL